MASIIPPVELSDECKVPLPKQGPAHGGEERMGKRENYEGKTVEKTNLCARERSEKKSNDSKR